MRLTKAQERVLNAANKHPLGRVVGGSDRTRQILAELKLIVIDGLNYGPTFLITEAGTREAARRAENGAKP